MNIICRSRTQACKAPEVLTGESRPTFHERKRRIPESLMFARILELVPKMEKREKFVRVIKNEVPPIRKQTVAFRPYSSTSSVMLASAVRPGNSNPTGTATLPPGFFFSLCTILTQLTSLRSRCTKSRERFFA